MGVFRVPIILKNWQNQFLPSEARGEDVQCEAMVDSGAVQLALPAEVIEQLRLLPLDTIMVTTADNGQHTYRVCGMVDLEVQGRRCQVRAIELPRGAEPLLGAIPLEEMDWHIDPLGQRLVPNPASPDRPMWPLK